MGSAWRVPQRVYAYIGVVTGLLVVAIGLWMLRIQMSLASDGSDAHAHDAEPDHEHEHAHEGHTHAHAHGHDHVHSHGWGVRHSHRVDLDALTRPRLPILLGLGIAGGLLPDPGALALLLAALSSGKLVLGLFTVVVFSIGFASVLVVVGVVAARVGAAVLTWLSGRWVGWLQTAAALLIVGGAIVVFSVVIPPALGLTMEMTVALMLVVLGLWNLTGLIQTVRDQLGGSTAPHAHAHRHGDYVHSHRHGHGPQDHGHAEER